jgi:putative Mg2+ transporter-C (MgtC) family protein
VRVQQESMTADLFRMIGTLVLATLLGGLVGWERERRDRPAGLRTHILVCMGSALITMVSERMAGTRSDPGRIAAQIVSGIGFLGAGTIMRQGNVVRGLTTAASLWTVAGIGMATAAGTELAIVGAAAAMLVVFTLTVMDRLEDTYITGRMYERLRFVTGMDRDAVARVLLGLAERGVETHGVVVEEDPERGELTVSLTLRTVSGFRRQAVADWLSRQPGIVRSDWG